MILLECYTEVKYIEESEVHVKYYHLTKNWKINIVLPKNNQDQRAFTLFATDA